MPLYGSLCGAVAFASTCFHPRLAAPRSPHRRTASSCCPIMSASPTPLITRKAVLALTASSAVLGPLLDNYHSQFGVLAYKQPLEVHAQLPSGLHFDFATAPFTPPLFVVAGLLIGVGALRINDLVGDEVGGKTMSMPRALATVAAFSALYYLSACLPGTAAASLLGPLLVGLAALEWYAMDGSFGGLVMGALTAVGGPLVEVGLINVGHLYSYTQPEVLGVPLFIVPVYFAGAPAVGNLARAFQQIFAGKSEGH